MEQCVVRWQDCGRPYQCRRRGPGEEGLGVEGAIVDHSDYPCHLGHVVVASGGVCPLGPCPLVSREPERVLGGDSNSEEVYVG